MKKLVLGLVLLLTATAGFAQSRPNTPELTPPENGQEWLRLSSTEKLFWAIGYSQGYREALDKIDVTAGPTSPCASLAIRTERQSSTSGSRASTPVGLTSVATSATPCGGSSCAPSTSRSSPWPTGT